MDLELAKALNQDRQRELARRADQQRALCGNREPVSHVASRRPAWRVPRYRVSWSRISLSRIGSAGRRERSWLIVISASRGL